VSETQVQNDPVRTNLEKYVFDHPNEEKLMEELQKKPMSEAAKKKIKSQGNVEAFGLCELSSKVQCP